MLIHESTPHAHPAAAFLNLRSVDEVRAFLRDLCTPAELQAMADRWAVVDLLRQGLPYREIHKLSGVSVTTIGRVARYLAAGNGGYAVAAGKGARSAAPAAARTAAVTSGMRGNAAPGGSRHG